MRKSRWGGSANDHKGRRKSLNKRSLRNRFLRAEALENRVLLAADWINPWHNDLDPGDVNGDGWRAPNDVLHVVSELNRNGSRELTPGHTGGAEGEAGTDLYWDVDGDGYLSASDALRGIHLLGEGEARGGAEWVRVRLYALDAANPDLQNPLTQITAGEEFILRTTVQDIRNENGVPVDGNFGVGAIYVDIGYDADQIRVKEGTSTAKPGVSTELDFAVTYKDPASNTGINDLDYPYSNAISGTLTDLDDIDLQVNPGEALPVGAGAINEFGGFTTLSFGTIEKFVTDTSVIAKSVVAVDDTFTVQEDETTSLDVLANGDGIVSGDVTITPSPSDFSPASEIVMLATANEWALEVDRVEEVVYEDVMFTVTNDATSFQLTEVLNVPAGHTAVIDDNGNSDPTDDVIVYSPPLDFVGDVSFEYEIQDNLGNADTAEVTVTVLNVNDTPVALDVSGVAATEDGDAVVGTFDADDVDDDDTPASLSYEITAIPVEGTVNTDGSQDFSFDPGADFQDLPEAVTRDVTFTYTATDSHGVASAPATVTVTVTGVNDAPTANDDNLNAVNTGVTVDLDVLANDVDPDDPDPLTVVALSDTGSIQGTVEIAADGLTVQYTPPAVLIGQETTAGQFDVTIEDSAGAQATATVVVTLVDNQPPVANDDAFTGHEDETIDGTVNVLADNGAGADSDPEGDDFSVSGFDAVSALGAAVSITSTGELTYDPTTAVGAQSIAQGETADDTFTYTIQDTPGGQGVGTVTVALTGANDAPSATNDLVNMDEEATHNGDLNGNTDDPDGSDVLVFAIADGVEQGLFSFDSDGTYSYTPATDFFGTDAFTFTATDPHGAMASATITFNVQAVNDAPVATDSSLVATREAASSHPFPVQDVDNTASELTITITTDLPNGDGAVSDNGDGTFSFDPEDDFDALQPGDSRDVTFSFEAADPGGLTSAEGTVTITVVANHPPTAVDDDGFSTDEETDVSGNVLADNGNGVDSDVEGDPIEVTAVAASVNGANVTFTASGDFTYQAGTSAALNALAVGEQTVDTFEYTITDFVNGNANGTDVGTVTVTVTGLNDAPQAVDATLATSEDNDLTGTLEDHASDPDTSDTLTYSIATDVNHGALVLASDGGFTYSPAAEFFGTDAFTFSATDPSGVTSSATITIDVAAVNDAPQAIDDTVFILTDGGVQAVDPLANDLPGAVAESPYNEDAQSLSIVSFTSLTLVECEVGPCETGTLTQDGEAFQYDPPVGFEGTVEFAVTITDDDPVDPLTDTQTVELRVIKFLPNSISGHVYYDQNDNSQKDEGEFGFGGIEVTLTGEDAFGRDVNLTQLTDATGFYRFDTNDQGQPLAPSRNYVVVASQASHIGDSGEQVITPGVANPLDNEPGQFRMAVAADDTFEVEIGLFGGADAVGNFGEFGWPTWAFTRTLASSDADGFRVLTSLSGDAFWDSVFGDFAANSVTLDLSNGYNSVLVTVVEQDNTSHSGTVDFEENANFSVLGVRNGQAVIEYDGLLQDLLDDLGSIIPDGEADPMLPQLETVEDAELLALRLRAEASGGYAEAIDEVLQSWS